MNKREKKLCLQLLFSALLFVPAYYLIFEKMPLLLIGYYIGCFSIIFTQRLEDDID